MLRRAPRHAARDLARPLDQHLDGLSEQRAVFGCRELLLHREQHLVAPLLLGRRDVVDEVAREGPGARRVLEDVALREADLPAERDRLVEVRGRLPRVADDPVAVQLDVGRLRPELVDALLVALDGVAAPHGLEHPVAARLRGEVQEARDLRQLRDRVDQVRAQEVRVRGDEREPTQRRDLVEAPQQPRERGVLPLEVSAVGVDGLPQQRDLGDAVVAQTVGLVDEVRDRSRDLVPPSRRHDAVAARHVAAPHDRHVGLALERPDPDVPSDPVAADAVVDAQHARPDHVVTGSRRLPARRQLRVLGARALDGVVDVPERRRPDDHVDVRHAREHVALVLLRHAAEHADDQLRLGALADPELAELGPDAVLGVLTHRAGVDQDDVGRRLLIRRHVTALLQASLDQLAVQLVHLAAVARQVVAGRGHESARSYGESPPNPARGATSPRCRGTFGAAGRAAGPARSLPRCRARCRRGMLFCLPLGVP